MSKTFNAWHSQKHVYWRAIYDTIFDTMSNVGEHWRCLVGLKSILDDFSAKPYIFFHFWIFFGIPSGNLT